MELVGLRHRHRGVGVVLDGVDVTLRAGRPTVVVGANGSGKSTLLQVAAGGLQPDGGRVHRRPAVTGYLPSPFPATSRFPVGGYLDHLDGLHGLAAGTSAAVLDALRFTGGLDAPVAALSAGNATKVGLAQALAPGVGLVVLDEPWTALDAAAVAALTTLLTGRAARPAGRDDGRRRGSRPGGGGHRGGAPGARGAAGGAGRTRARGPRPIRVPGDGRRRRTARAPGGGGDRHRRRTRRSTPDRRPRRLGGARRRPRRRAHRHRAAGCRRSGTLSDWSTRRPTRRGR